jgi:hypothetical protein
MVHIARSFAVSLSIRHPDIDPAVISAALGLVPKWASRAGMPRTAPKGEPSRGTYQVSHWSHQFDVQGALDLGPVLEDLVEKLHCHKSFFHRIVEEGGEVEFFCGVWAAGNWDESLPHSLLGRLAELRVNLRLDVYPQKDV